MRRLLVAGSAVAMLVAGCVDANDMAPPTSVTPSPPQFADISTSTASPSESPAGVALPATDSVERAPAAADAPVEGLVAGWNDAGFELLRSQPADENVVFSPAGIGHALLMAEAAADTATRAAMRTAFALPAGAHEAWNRIDQDFAASQSEQVIVVIADRIWPGLDVQPDQAWIDLLASQHGADVVPLDLAGDPDGSRNTINSWVSERTEKLIPELVPDGFITPETVLVLTDTVYFKAGWERPFGKYEPVDGMFTTFDGEQVPTAFMRELELTDGRGTGDGFIGAEIPYAGGHPDAFLDAAVHAADISVNKFGTTAAAATGLAFPASGPPEPEVTVAADRPFIYVIRHRPTGLALFVGHVTDPR